MKKRSKTRKVTSGGFDPVVFLETAAKGRIVSTNSKGQIIFAQGDAADSVYYIKTGKVPSYPNTARKPLSQSSVRTNSWVRDA
jgi:hypothetical protein